MSDEEKIRNILKCYKANELEIILDYFKGINNYHIFSTQVLERYKKDEYTKCEIKEKNLRNPEV